MPNLGWPSGFRTSHCRELAPAAVEGGGVASTESTREGVTYVRADFPEDFSRASYDGQLSSSLRTSRSGKSELPRSGFVRLSARRLRSRDSTPAHPQLTARFSPAGIERYLSGRR